MSEGHFTDKPKRTTLLIVVLMLAFLGCFCPFINALPFRLILAKVDGRYVSGQVESIPFDRDLWMSRNARYRVAMAQYFADNNQLDGKTRSELAEMLGEPDVDQPGNVRWLLGYEVQGLFDETFWLVLTIGEKGTASDATVSVGW